MTQSPSKRTLPPEERVGYAVVGVGELSTEEILPAFGLSGLSRLAAIVTGHPEQELDRARAHGLSEADVYSYDQLDELHAREDVRAVYLVTPNSLHREYTVSAARAGKHVLCEKPMATSVEDARAMVEVCDEQGVKLMVAYRCQYTPHHWAARDLIQGGKLGRVRLFESVNGQHETDETQWRLKYNLAGGGPLPDVGLYCLNTIRFLLAVEPTEVFAYQYQPQEDERFVEVEEALTWQMRFPGGVLASCLTSYNIETVRSLRAMGETGWLSLDPAFDYQGLRLEVGTGDGREEKKVQARDQFTLELDHFSQCILDDVRPFTPGEEGLQDQKIMAAIYQSAREGRPIQLEHFEGRDVFRGSTPEGRG